MKDSKLLEKINELTLEEKIDLCEGADYWRTRTFKDKGIPSAMMCDGPHGLRKQPLGTDNLGINASIPAVCFPTAAATACSWDRQLLSDIGKAIGEEARANGVALVLGPGLNVKRNPLCGRNFEYFSEDPYASGELAAAYVNGMQETGVGACLKHFAANSQEFKRHSSDSVMDERTLREIYLAGFEGAVKKSKPAAVMSSYNKLNGEHTGDSEWLLKDVLRTEWGFDGMVVTDWGAMNDRIKGMKAGCDLMMPGGSHYWKKKVIAAVKAGELSESDIDFCAENVLRFVEKAQTVTPQPCDMQVHHELARRAAEQSAVLLKNDGTLPVKGKVCIIGYMAKKLRYQGVGSSHINPYKLAQPADLMDWPCVDGYNADGSTNEGLISEAVRIAKTVDTPVIFAGLTDKYEAEGFDRVHMKMPEGMNRLIEAVAAANANTAVVLMCGSPVEMPWADKVGAILYMALPGEAGAEAIKALLTGEANPSGRLSDTWPMRYEDTVTSEIYGEKDAEYREGIFVGYRYYDSANVPVRYKFGHGLSYTKFEYSDLTVENGSVSVTVKNVGDTAGSEVVLMFVEPPKGSVIRPARELKGFDKMFLKPGEAKRVSLELCDRSFAVWYEGAWHVPEGEYKICVGELSAGYIPENEEKINAPENLSGTWYETLCGKPSKADWEKLIGYKYESEQRKVGEFDLDSTIMEMAPNSRTMRILKRAIELVMARHNGGKVDYENPEFKMMVMSAADSAIRNVAICGGIGDGITEWLLKRANRGK